MPKERKEIAIVLVGEAGQGVQTVEFVLTRVLKRSGFHVFATKEYMSRVRGGLNSTEIRVSSARVSAHVDRIDLLVPLGPGAIEHVGDRLTTDTVVLGDCAVLGECTYLGDEHPIHDIPFTEMARELGNKVYFNVIAVGVVVGLLDADQDVLEDYLARTFERKGDEVVAKNLEAARLGRGIGDRLRAEGLLPCDIDRHEEVRGELLLSGAEAVGSGAIAGGCNLITSYPMSPSTGVLTFLAQRARRFGIIAEQAEDEIAAINMSLGGWYAGARGMVTTSGGGFALMEEGVSLAGIIESPAVIHLAQRPGPATGLPTRTEQGDLSMVLHAGHGEFPRVVLAPGDIHEAFHLTRQAFDLADALQVPVFVLTDQYTMDSYYNTTHIDLEGLEVESHVVETDADYLRYRITDDGISPRGVPGHGSGLVKADSDEHDEEGTITEDLDLRVRMNGKRLRKADLVRRATIAPSYHGPDEPRLLVIAWGSTKGVVLEAIDDLGRDDVALLHLPWVYPLPDEVRRRIAAADHTVIVEGNATSQLGRLIRAETGIDIYDRLLKHNGMQFSVEEVQEFLARTAEEVA